MMPGVVIPSPQGKTIGSDPRVRRGAHVWQAIPARKRLHSVTYHLHYGVKNTM